MRVLAIGGAVLLGGLLIFIGAFGARWLDPAQSDADATNGKSAQTAAKLAKSELDLQTMGELLDVLDAKRRSQILDSEEYFQKFVNQETLNQAVLAAAYANGAHNNDAIRVLMERAGQRVLVEAYLNQVVRLNFDPAFPSPEQVRGAFDANPTVFVVPKRMHLWQIFISLNPDADAETNKAAWQLADRIAADLRSGKATFEDMAKQHSTHAPSRVNDGYMGLIKVAELLPSIAEAAGKIEIGGISDPIASETGLHIIKRGDIVEQESLDFDNVRAKVRERMVREAVQKVRQAALEKISEEFPVKAPTEDIESWRESLLKRNKTPAPVSDDGQKSDSGD